MIRKSVLVWLAAIVMLVGIATLSYWLTLRSLDEQEPTVEGPDTRRHEDLPIDKVRQVAKGLDSKLPEERKAAEEQLATFPYEWRPELRQVTAEATGDAQALLRQRLAEMDEHFAPESPRITLRAERQSLRNLIQQMGVAPERVKFSVNARQEYSLDVENETFWGVFQMLQMQNPGLELENSSASGGEMVFADQRVQMQAAVKGNLALFYRYWPEEKRARGSTTPARIDALLAIDPRLSVVEVEFDAQEIQDETGRVLYTPEKTPSDFFRHTTACTTGKDIRLTLPAGESPRIPVLKVKARVVYVLASESGEITNLSGNESLKLGKTTVTVSNFRQENQIFLNVDSKAQGITPYAIYNLYDGGGALVRQWTWAGAQASGAALGGGRPYRLKVIAPQKVKEVQEEFVLLDVVARP